MCWEDIQIGRAMKGGRVVKAQSATSIAALSASEERSLIVFNAPTFGRITYSIAPTAVDGEGITLSVGDSPVMLDIKRHGDLVKRAWQSISVAGLGRQVDTFRSIDTVDNGIATAIIAANTEQTHLLDSIGASFNDTTADQNVTIEIGTTVEMLQSFVDSIVIDFAEPWPAQNNQAVEGILSASGVAGDIGTVWIKGRSYISAALGSATIETEGLALKKSFGGNHAAREHQI